jgi:hypothetical protein
MLGLTRVSTGGLEDQTGGGMLEAGGLTTPGVWEKGGGGGGTFPL